MIEKIQVVKSITLSDFKKGNLASSGLAFLLRQLDTSTTTEK
ncbi:hypothetical protein [Lentilactobacillus parafarraginis]|nr:hypothetical protein [Lentilactobacillus parafarraginis]